MIYFLRDFLIQVVAILVALGTMFGLTAGFVNFMVHWQAKHQQWLAHSVDVEVRDEGGYQVVK